ncbi:unnamed protein product [Spirodela intermedia]|uniref:Uncharacterized protein n=2 Tax=Spirodela intermedia TaxID=51605 RepID=A0A7I8ITZ4_SPIIN|nr:unnamed protein product [Spirodela intermedia]CAA6661446.1 unnamed protein product [Spirodela intermedia]CAA7397806.1 unnamed protein product [Spirodela intermedia]
MFYFISHKCISFSMNSYNF